MVVTTDAEDPKKSSNVQMSHRSVYPTWIIFGVWCVAIGLCTFVTQALFLSTLPSDCALFLALGGFFLVVGMLMTAGGCLALWFRALQPKAQPSTTGQCAGRVCLFLSVFLFSGILLVMMVVGGGFYRMKKSQASLEMDFSGAAGLSAPVTITRDTAGIPHINAETMDDAFFGQGYVTAQDRLFWLEIFRLFATGRLAEIGGEDAVETDKLTRTLGFAAVSARVYNEISGETKASMASFAEGINFYMEKDGAMPPEFMFFGDLLFSYYRPEPFSSLDVVTMMIYMQYVLSNNKEVEAMRWKLFNRGGLSRDDVEGMWYADFANQTSVLDAATLNISADDVITRTAAVLASEAAEASAYATTMLRFRDNHSLGATSPSYRGFEQQAAQETEKPTRKDRKTVSLLSDPKAYFAMLLVDDLHKGFFKVGDKGSNAWFTRHAATGTVTGGGDPHLSIRIPNWWYAIQLNVGGSVNDVYSGMSVPGVPGILYGKNNHLMWSVTVSNADLADLYVMEPDQNNLETHYMYHGESLAYTTRTESLKVKGSDDVNFEVQSSVLGPIIGEEWELTTHHKIALNFSGCLGSTPVQLKSLNTMFGLFRHHTVSDFRAGLQNFSAPGLSYTAADSQGGLMYMSNGLHPIRREGHTGKWPVLGDGTYDHLAFIPADELPYKLDLDITSDGFISSANQRVTPDGYPYSVSFDYEVAYRGDRIKLLLSNVTSTEIWNDVDFHKTIQTDIRSNWWLDYLLPKLVSHGTAWTDKLDASGTALWNTMLAWDGQVSFNSQEAYYLEEWNIKMGSLPGDTLLEVLEWDLLDTRHLTERVVLWPTSATNRLCAEKSGNGATDCLPFIANSWNTVATQTPKSFGIEYAALNIEHVLFGGSILSCLTDRLVHKQGDGSSINYNSIDASSFDPETAHKKSSPNFRHLMSFNWTTGYHFTMTAGQSGHFFSYYFDNQIDDIGTDTYRFIEYGANPSDATEKQVLTQK